jgi:hypothetical protein
MNLESERRTLISFRRVLDATSAPTQSMVSFRGAGLHIDLPIGRSRSASRTPSPRQRDQEACAQDLGL